MPTLHERIVARNSERHDKQIAVIRDLIRQGKEIAIRNAKEQRELRASLRELTNSLKRGTNAQVRRKLPDLQ